jgi:hypothetical protein
VTGEEFRGKRLAFGYAASSGREAHDEILHKLKAARAINVRYNPANPAQSTLSYGIHRSIRFLVVFAMTWLFFTAGFAVLMLLSSSADSVLLENLSVH